MLRRALCLLRPEPFAAATGQQFHGFRADEPKPMMDASMSELQKPQVLVKDREKIGWVGLGDMGMGMLWKVVKEPQHSVHVWNRNERKLKAYAKYVEESLQRHMFQRPMLLDVPRFADVIVVSLGNIRAVREVLLERDDSILYNASPGTIIIDHSTVDAATTAECQQIADARGVAYLDAPIVGSPELAKTGNLSVMVGGDPHAYRRVARIMAKYAQCVEYMGESGSGTRAKMVAEAAIAVQAVASAETALLAKSMGIGNMDSLTRLLDHSLAGSNMFKRNAPFWPSQFTTKTKIGTGQSVSRSAKNLRILNNHLHDAPPDLHTNLPYLRKAQEIVNACGNAGGHDADVSSVLHFLNPDDHNTDIYWDVPVDDKAQNAALQRHLEQESHDEYQKEQEARKWSDVTEFADTYTTSPAVESSMGAPPRINPEKLEELYSKAKPRMAAMGDTATGHTVQRSAYNPGLEHLTSTHPAVRKTMERFAAVGQAADKGLGRASFNGVAFQQRTPGLLNPMQEGLLDGVPDDTPPQPPQ
eukprot:TRINITY_DN9744_c0_g2_i1.p1 TRINITY_DN9744_c0_g2~~TRINITY_DN9744_c0_g2_i1.p1  ORF type:complete len:530 (+),score=170.22 TRINITY_DN9744_c0_g2_i1:45-1634(+)